MGFQRFGYDLVVRNGTVAARSEVAGYPSSNIQTRWKDYVWKAPTDGGSTAEYVTAEAASAQTVNFCAFYGANFTADVVLHLYHWTSSAWVDLDVTWYYDPTTGDGICFFNSVTKAKFKFEIEDGANADNYVKFGVLQIGLYQELSIGYDYNSNFDYDEESEVSMSLSGYATVTPGYDIDKFSLAYSLRATDKAKLLTVWRSVKRDYAFAYIEDSLFMSGLTPPAGSAPYIMDVDDLRYVRFADGLKWTQEDSQTGKVSVVLEKTK
jgi:hypothetical protein